LIFFFYFYLLEIFSWKFVHFFCYILIIQKVWRFLLYCELIVLNGTLPEISYKGYYQQKYQVSSIKDASVKDDDSLELTRSQDSVLLKCVSVAEYDWKYLILERNYEFTVFLKIFLLYIDFFYLFIFFSFTFLFFFFFVDWKKYFFFFFIVQQVFESLSLFNHGAITKIGCLNISLPV
jgi:hypothetical protein